jgi:hypothetical protein
MQEIKSVLFYDADIGSVSPFILTGEIIDERN